MKSYSPKEVMKILQKNGWKLNRVRGGHYIFSKKGEINCVIVSVSKSAIPIGTLKNIEKQSGIKFN